MENHESMSDMHKANLTDEHLVARANRKLAKDRLTPRFLTDAIKKCCYLCNREFPTDAGMMKHERKSGMHKGNLANGDLTVKANAYLANAGFAPRYFAGAGEHGVSDYRDRAKERRQAFGSTKRISLPMKKSASKPEGEKEEENATLIPSKGATLLGKMVWSDGEGLGAQGSGRTAPIATDMYVQGVGLGAQGGKIGDAAGEADRNTRSSYSEFLERTKDKAKERFERMG